MRFFKNNYDTIIKLLVNQIGVAILTFFLYTAAGAIKTDDSTGLTIKVAISIFGILFYYVLIYNIAWEIGAKDKIRVDGGRATATPGKGIRLGLYANITNFAVIGLAAIVLTVYIISKADYLYSFFAVLNFIFRFFVSMYLGIIQAICHSYSAFTDMYFLAQTLCFLIFSVISAIVVHISYTLGFKDYRFIKQKKTAKK